MLPSQPQREAGVIRRHRGHDARITRDEPLNRGNPPQLLPDGDSNHQQSRPKRYRPEHIEPPLTNADVRDHAALRWCPMAQADPVVSEAKLGLEQIGLRALTCGHLVISNEYQPQTFEQPRAANARSRGTRWSDSFFQLATAGQTCENGSKDLRIYSCTLTQAGGSRRVQQPTQFAVGRLDTLRGQHHRLIRSVKHPAQHAGLVGTRNHKCHVA